MNLSVNIPFPKRNLLKPGLLFVAAYLIIAGIALNDYLAFRSVRGIVGIVGLLFVLQTTRRGNRSYRFAWMTGVFLVLCLLMPVKTLLYFAISFAILFFIECFYGKIGLLPVFIIVFVSPVFKYFADSFSFPLRLKLTSLAGSFLSIAGHETIAKGNLIIHHGREFSVDPGCMGLNMMETSLLLGTILIAFYQIQFGTKLKGWSLLTYFSFIILLNVITNLFRIIILVKFAIMPGTAPHDVVGLVCLMVYVFIPAVWLAKKITKHAPMQEINLSVTPAFARHGFFLHTVLLSCMTVLAVYVMNADTYRKLNLERVKEVNGFSSTQYAPGILKLQSMLSLVYIKYIRGFYDTDHNPMICWKGSGYTFEQVQLQKQNGNEIYTALLVKDEEKLYTAWWYTNGTTITADQFTWRWNMLSKKEKYSLVNVTCASREALDDEIERITKEKVLAVFFTDSIYN